MKKYVVIASLIAGLSMISGAAFAQTSGTIGASYSRDDDTDSDAWGVNGGVTIPTSGNLVVLLDAGYTTNDDADVDALSGTGHLIVRDPSMAWGGFLGVGNVDAGGGADADFWGGGGEFAKFFTNSTLALTAGYVTADDADIDVTGVTGEFRIFANDNLRFDIGAGWANVDAGGGGDDDGTLIGAGVEYRFGNSPISIGGNVSRVDTGGGDSTVFGATLRFDFGNDSLKARDRSGNTFGGIGGLGSFLF